MYALFRSLFDSIISAVLALIGKGTTATEATECPNLLRRGGRRITEYIRSRMQSGRAGQRSKPDTDRE